MSISILGCGSWGSALAIAFSHAFAVKLWGRNLLQVNQINASRINPGYLPESISFPPNILATTDLSDALNSELIVIATPLNSLREVLLQIRQLRPLQMPDIIWACKGLELNSGLFPHQIVEDIFGKVDNVAALLGPSFANEVALGLPTAIALSGENQNFVMNWIHKLQSIPNFRIYANTDVIGSEVGSAVKNIMAIAVGIVDGLNLGFNARAALMTRSLNELSQLVIALGGKPETIYGLTGVGDLILTCTGDLSRNRKVGLELAKGNSLEQVLIHLGHVAEGVYATEGIYRLSKKLGLNMPIIECVYKVLYEQADISATIDDLMKRAPKLEF